jgi:hypothetical protein
MVWILPVLAALVNSDFGGFVVWIRGEFVVESLEKSGCNSRE